MTVLYLIPLGQIFNVHLQNCFTNKYKYAYVGAVVSSVTLGKHHV